IDLQMGTAWKAFKELPQDDRPVFTQIETGKRMDVATPSHKFKDILDRYNASAPEGEKLPQIRLHDLRHTSATLLLSNNMDIETVSHRLGHSKASVTLDVYGHWTEETDKTASQTLARLFG
ncbi:MAG: tyrosine-type recombinase/integrase, partial [Lachnospiraceae bacterium]|nr:tyrosine-type recombinase/integrase [Lachnospiraceae bacterium]